MLTSTPYELEMHVYDRQRHVVRIAELARALRASLRREPARTSCPDPEPARPRIALVP